MSMPGPTIVHPVTPVLPGAKRLKVPEATGGTVVSKLPLTKSARASIAVNTNRTANKVAIFCILRTPLMGDRGFRQAKLSPGKNQERCNFRTSEDAIYPDIHVLQIKRDREHTSRWRKCLHDDRL